VFWHAVGEIYRGWVRSVSGNAQEGLLLIDQRLKDPRLFGAALALPLFLTLKAEALYLADRTPEALEEIKKAEAPTLTI
jgi:hypothetical protein